MAVQVRNKQPRPLSIISEGGIDDIPGSDAEVASPKNVHEIKSSEEGNRPKSARRRAVAPRQHPLAELTQENALGNGRDVQVAVIDANADLLSNSLDIGIHYDNDKPADVKHETSSSHNLLFNSGPTVVQPYNFCPANQSSSTDNTCIHDVVSSTYSRSLVRRDENKNVYTKVSSSNDLNLSGNVASDIGVDTEIITDKPKNNASSSHACNDDTDGNCIFSKHDNMDGSKRADVKNGKLKTIQRYKDEIDKSCNVDNAPTIDAESLDQEQRTWRTRVRKSSSFTHSSKTSLPLRRSMGSFDYKNSASIMIARNRFLHANKGQDNDSADKSNNSKVVFYLSSDVEADQKYKLQTHCLEHEQLQPLSSSLSRNYSWHGWRNPAKDGTIESGKFNFKEFIFTENLGRMFTSNSSTIDLGKSENSILSDNDKCQSNLERSNSQKTTNYKQSHSGVQSNLPPYRRISTVDQSDFSLLKATAARLNLPTRRPSTTAWKAEYLDNVAFMKHTDVPQDLGQSEDSNIRHSQNKSLSGEDRKIINQSLCELRQELINLRQTDQNLARQFLGIRHTMNQLRLAVHCQGHMKLLDEAQEDFQEMRELSRLVDIPPELLAPFSSLQHVGLTRLNLDSRRFSTC